MSKVSVIIPVLNGEKWINNCMQSIAAQTAIRSMVIEIVVFNDGSTDGTHEILENWANYFVARGINFILSGAHSTQPKGVGSAKNAAVKISTGEYLCFQDIDDVMYPNRILSQYSIAKSNHNALVGCNITRIPENSTPRLVRWANSRTDSQLRSQIYTSNGPTILMPTWFCHKNVFERVGGFSEAGYGVPEDLIFFHKHLTLGGDVYRINEELVIYTYHKNATTLSITRERIWQLQLQLLQLSILPKWSSFIVWNAGKWGRRFVRGLDPINQKKVIGFCDVDKNKIGQTIELYCPKKRKVILKIPVFHFTDVKPPLIICMKQDLTNGEFESNLKSLNLKEGIDYAIFS